MDSAIPPHYRTHLHTTNQRQGARRDRRPAVPSRTTRSTVSALKGTTLSLEHSISFFRQYLRTPELVGAFVPSSRSLAAAVCTAYRRHNGPARVLEVGAGTGAITRYLGRILGRNDFLDICEISDELADILERDVLSGSDFAAPLQERRVRLLRMPVQRIQAEGQYDFVISGLPLTAFTVEMVNEILDVLRRALKPEGVLSYYEYVGVRRASEVLFLGQKRVRYRQVSRCLTDNIRRHQFDKQTVLRNIPPAHARHLRFGATLV